MNVALYARVSTSDQSCQLQLDELARYAAARGWTVFDQYVDTGWSGRKSNRPQLDRLMQDARLRKIDAVLVWKLDRWGRTVQHALASIQELTGLGVRWISVTQGLDTDQSNPISRLLLTVIAGIAEFEQELARERVKAGLESARSRGQVFGRPRVIYDRLKALELQKQGIGLRPAARQLKISTRTLARLWQKALAASPNGTMAEHGSDSL